MANSLLLLVGIVLVIAIQIVGLAASHRRGVSAVMDERWDLMQQKFLDN